MKSEPRVKLPGSARAGAIITIKTLIRHRMESGRRAGDDGTLVPRDIVRRFSASFDGEAFFTVDIEPAMAANPYLEFTARVDEAGTFRFSWTDDSGKVTVLERDIALEP